VKTLQNFVNGKKVSASSDKVQDLINPATGQVFAKAPVSNAADVDKAMQPRPVPLKFGKSQHQVSDRRQLIKLQMQLKIEVKS